MTPTNIYAITPDELFEVFQFRTEVNRYISLDNYTELRPYASHEQALEVVDLGTIKPKNYIHCLKYGNATHDEIMHAATVEVPGRRWGPGPVFNSNFDRFVEDYFESNKRISLAEAVVGYQLGITNKGAYSLEVMLKYATIEDIARAWKQLGPRQKQYTFRFRKLVANNVPPQETLGMLPL